MWQHHDDVHCASHYDYDNVQYNSLLWTKHNAGKKTICKSYSRTMAELWPCGKMVLVTDSATLQNGCSTTACHRILTDTTADVCGTMRQCRSLTANQFDTDARLDKPNDEVFAGIMVVHKHSLPLFNWNGFDVAHNRTIARLSGSPLVQLTTRVLTLQCTTCRHSLYWSNPTLPTSIFH